MNPRDLMLVMALGQVGVEEYKGKAHNPAVMKYFHQCGWTAQNFTDETAWCSAFMNWLAEMSHAQRSRKLNARSWLEVGEEIDDPEMGDIVVLWRENKNGWKGHVGLYMDSDSTHIAVLGGNQSNQVNIKMYPKERLLGYRRLDFIL